MNADATDEHGVIVLSVAHDPTCPWYTAQLSRRDRRAPRSDT